MDKNKDILFTFSKDKEEIKKQSEFLLSYYTTRLKLLRSENYNLYITAEQAAEETFYKDIIASSMLFLQETNKTI